MSNKENDNRIREIQIISSKSDAHRAIICSGLAGGPEIQCYETSVDIEATRDCMTSLCGEGNEAELRCRESGTTFRLLLPVVGALGKKGVFHPEGRLSKRPLSPLYEELEAHGMKLSPQGEVPFVTEGRLSAGDFEIPGDVSSQFISGLLLALPLVEGESRVLVAGPLESAGYVNMTLATMDKFGVKVDIEENPDIKGSAGKDISIVYKVRGGQKYTAPDSYQVDGDWSNGAFWLAAGILGDFPIKVKGLTRNSTQGDKAIVDVIKAFGGGIEVGDDFVTAYPSGGLLKGIEYDAGQTPDMIPVVALIATQAQGETLIKNAGRLRIKESDRLNSISETLKALGGDIDELEDSLVIRGGEGLDGGKVDSFNDHRIAMMAAIASIVSKENVMLTGSKAVAKSYPGFYDRLAELGLEGNLKTEE